MQEARNFIHQYYHEQQKEPDEMHSRIQEIRRQIDQDGTYEHTFDELTYGAKVAWRNSNKCIGRLFWNRLHVFDAREKTNAHDIFQALFHHVEFATNGGQIRPTITIFKPANQNYTPVRIWNHQLLRYAGYETKHGVIGDSASISFTKACLELGWRGENTHFDLLPLVIQVNGKKPVWMQIPKNIVQEVPIEHPKYAIFADSFSVKWYAVPIISDMRLEIGGIHYAAAPFNGWYMETEIGARNLADEDRYDLLPVVAKSLGLEMSSNSTLWKDRALVELNIAVLHSFKLHGVSIVDHHTAAQQFLGFEKNEQVANRALTGNWTWLIPPLSPATTHIFHRGFDNTILKPNYFYQDKPYKINTSDPLYT